MSLEGLSLQPIEPAGRPTSASGPAKFQIDTRSKVDRRKGGDRRQTVRFEEDRRKGDRRAKANPWDHGADL
ncbi:hypothetical protein [Pseudomonas sp. LFM046]|uniref:hypothetical protein n=1 Tax=Pseudomonas sp. LFM046 TaxID=1608357 RepID=UPI001F5BCDD5|nr:hypothetical protein [Pseudomonas sp. LFM046]